MSTYYQLGRSFHESLLKLKEENKSFDMFDISAFFEDISTNINESDEEVEADIKNEITQLSNFIKSAKNDLINVDAEGASTNASGDAAEHLNAITTSTAEASEAILDSVDGIQALATDHPNQEAIGEAITKIYEACNFQDLTNQRVNKVIKIIDGVDNRVARILALFNNNGSAPAPKSAEPQATVTDEDLLNGPQLPDEAPSQDDIDALFASFKS